MMSISNVSAATHIAFEGVTSDKLLQLGAKNVVQANDCLVIGPCRNDPVEHERERESWWASPESEKFDFLYSKDIRWDLPIFVWVSASVMQRVNLWRTCKWLSHLGIPANSVHVLAFPPVAPRRPREGPAPPFDCMACVSHHSDEVLLEHFAQARPLSRRSYERAVALWDRYTDKDPRSFVRACRRGSKEFPELASVWAVVSSFFPRRTRAGALRVSRFDELLLSTLSEDWQTPVAVFVHKSEAGERLRELLCCTGDLFVPRRLDHWAAHRAVAAVERTSGPTPDNPMKASVYRITEYGRQVREGRLDELANAPPLPVAGTEVYAPSEPWELLEDGRLERV